jgi:hypothetical protein
VKKKEIVKLVDSVYGVLDSIPSRKRVKQLELWLRKNFPTPYPVVVHVEKISDNVYGECYKWTGNVTIRINKNIPKAEQLHSLIHEWAHAMTWPNRKLEKSGRPEHPDEWGLAYAKIYRQCFDEGGFLISANLKLDEEIFKLVLEAEHAE